MANEKLKQLPLFDPATDSNPKNLFWCSVWQSGDEGENGTYVSKRFRKGDLTPELLGYKRYISKLTQAGINAPVQEVLINELGFEVTTIYEGVGDYRFNFPENYFVDKKVQLIPPANPYAVNTGSTEYRICSASSVNDSSLGITVALQTQTTFAAANDTFYGDYADVIEIRIYDNV